MHDIVEALVKSCAHKVADRHDEDLAVISRTIGAPVAIPFRQAMTQFVNDRELRMCYVYLYIYVCVLGVA